MTADEGLAILEGVLGSEYLSQTQVVVFRKAWEGKSYVEIAVATGYEHGYIKDTGAQLWKLLSRVLGKKVTKNNFRNIICGLSPQPKSLAEPSHRLNKRHSTCLNQSWGEAGDVTSFYGRVEEQRCLEKWLVDDRCRLVSMLGIGGVGKTALSIKVAKQIQGEFDYVVWRSLRHAPPLAELLPEVILFLSEQQDTQIPNTASKQVEKLLTYLRQHRCLVILDNLEAILQTGGRAGKYREGYETYGYLLERVADGAHQSCVMVTSRERPGGVSVREGNESRVRSLDLSGLDGVASQSILRNVALVSNRDQHRQLIERYSGNPLALKIVAATIRSVFNGDVDDFLAYGTVVFGDLWDLLDQQFHRLSKIEQTVMRWLAINREWTSLEDLRADIIPAVSHRILLEAIDSLRARSLIEIGTKGITQQPVVMEYMTERLVSQFYEEINQQSFETFNHYALLKASAKEFVREAQVRQLSRKLLDRLLITSDQQSVLEDKLKQILVLLQQKAVGEVGYAGGNILNLLCQLDADLQGLDLSNLKLWQAYLVGKELQRVNLAHADLAKSVFTEPLSSVISVAFSPDGQTLAAGDTNGRIHLWNISGGKKLAFWKAHTGWIWSVSFSQDNRRIVSCSEDGELKIWNAETGQLQQVLKGHSKRLWSVIWHPHKQQLVSGSEDGTVRVWDSETGVCLKTIVDQEDAIHPVDISPNGRLLASAGATGNDIQIWDYETGQCLRTLRGHTGGFWTLTFSPDGRTLISGSVDKTVRIWDVKNGACLKVLEGHTDVLWAVATNQDGRLIASGGNDRTVRIWDSATGQCLKTLHGFTARIWSLAFNSQHPMLVSGDDQMIKL
ncbi:MAG: NB-ARC domain-containing protein [Cyanobacteria bacterium J06650_10]